MSLKFIKIKEDFICENCGQEVKGNGYTNHCPKCFFSKHVDIFPGDRGELCGGLMEPTGLEQKASEFVVVQKCQKCGKETKNRLSTEDDFLRLVAIVEEKSK